MPTEPVQKKDLSKHVYIHICLSVHVHQSILESRSPLAGALASIVCYRKGVFPRAVIGPLQYRKGADFLDLLNGNSVNGLSCSSCMYKPPARYYRWGDAESSNR